MAEKIKNKIDYIEDVLVETFTPSAAVTLHLGALAMQFARVERVPRYEDGERESDAEHSFMLALVATELSHHLFPDSLDQGKISQYAMVHDLIELKTGDVSTFGISAQSLAEKEKNEHEALDELLQELPSYTKSLVIAYESQKDKESRFVRAVDKNLPLVVDIVGQGRRVMQEDHNIHSVPSLLACQETVHQRMHDRFSEFPQIIEDHRLLGELFATVFEATE